MAAGLSAQTSHAILLAMSLQQQINDGWKDAMKSGATQRRDVLSGLRAAIKNAEIEARTSGGEGVGTMEDDGVLRVIEREAKKRRDAIEEYGKVNREDRAQTEREELEILQEFLPAQLSDAELEAEVKAAISESGATSAKDMGAVMKVLSPKIQGRADGKTASALVRQLLSAAS